jgi:UDP-glucose 4-epimerase
LQPQATGGTFLAAHAQGASTPQLIGAIRSHLGRPQRLLHVRPRLLEAAAGMAGQSDRIRPLTRSLEVDAAETTARLGWTAQIAFDAAIDDTVRAYREASS